MYVAFELLAVGSASPDDGVVPIACALTLGKGSVAAACAASNDALETSEAAFYSLCKEAFKALPPAPPRLPPPS